MLRMTPSQSADDAKRYFSDALAKADYFLNDQEMKGVLHGKLSTRLGLTGEITKDIFFSLCENRNPLTNEGLTPRTKTERTVGYDITFSAPKSVSIVQCLSKDDRILDVFRNCVQQTMADIEADAKTRVRQKGKDEDRDTKELLWVEFVHLTSRPVEDHAPDPHLHSHCYVFNATFDETEDKMKAGQFRYINRDMPYYQALFDKRLADSLQKMGYNIRRTEKSFEIDGVPQKAIELFSKRSDEIVRVAKEKGITDAKKLAQLGAKTRSRKQKNLSMAQLKEDWRKQIRDAGHEKEIEGKNAIKQAFGKGYDNITPDKCLNHALHHCFERASVIPERKILAQAYHYGIGAPLASPENIDAQLAADKAIIRQSERHQVLCTTASVLKEEQRMVALAKEGLGQVHPLYAKAPNIDLKGEQLRAVRHVLTTSNRVSII
jgi:conjugative relaxase-like TrwC/TraI family protein